jgi:hypothetical protein
MTTIVIMIITTIMTTIITTTFALWHRPGSALR